MTLNNLPSFFSSITPIAKMLWTIEPGSGFAAVASVCDRRNLCGSALTERRYRAKVQMKVGFDISRYFSLF
jgi:hypothetical protein